MPGEEDQGLLWRGFCTMLANLKKVMRWDYGFTPKLCYRVAALQVQRPMPTPVSDYMLLFTASNLPPAVALPAPARRR